MIKMQGNASIFFDSNKISVVHIKDILTQHNLNYTITSHSIYTTIHKICINFSIKIRKSNILSDPNYHDIVATSFISRFPSCVVIEPFILLNETIQFVDTQHLQDDQTSVYLL